MRVGSPFLKLVLRALQSYYKTTGSFCLASFRITQRQGACLAFHPRCCHVSVMCVLNQIDWDSEVPIPHFPDR